VTARGRAGRRKDWELAQQIGRAARQARMRLKWTQADVAERIGIQTEVYGRVERGVMLPSTPTLLRLRTALGVTSDLLLGLAPETAGEKGNQAPTAARDETPPEVRRLLRSIREMDGRALATFKEVAGALVKHHQRRAREPDDARDLSD
jgi:transcriptional regulator with XRE-family HTH domain